jgi:hypothetical protein
MRINKVFEEAYLKQVGHIIAEDADIETPAEETKVLNKVSFLTSDEALIQLLNGNVTGITVKYVDAETEEETTQDFGIESFGELEIAEVEENTEETDQVEECGDIEETGEVVEDVADGEVEGEIELDEKETVETSEE